MTERRTDVGGAALVEALVAVPVLGVVLAGIVAVNAMYSAKIEARSRARRIAWLQSDSGDCPDESCMGAACSEIAADIEAQGLGGLSSVEQRDSSLSAFIGGVGRFLVGGMTHGVAVARLPIPEMIGTGLTSQRGSITLLCNTTPRRTESEGRIIDHACSTGLGSTEYAREVCN